MAAFVPRNPLRLRRPRRLLPPLRLSSILRWADAHHARSGDWPWSQSGRIPETLDENWRKVDNALRLGLRGLPGGSSLALLLKEQRHKRVNTCLPQFQVKTILRWVDAYRKRTGAWPTRKSGPIPEAPGETWHSVARALHLGTRGLPRSSLAGLLAEKRGAYKPHLQPLRIMQIVTWARAHRQRTGAWPNQESGRVEGAHGETWRGIDLALRNGNRGLPKGSSLARLLVQECGVRNRTTQGSLSVDQILAWADAHFEATGDWPTYSSGAIVGAPGETWRRVAEALDRGYRGLPGGMPLPRLLFEKRQARKQTCLPRLRIRAILAWADAHFRKTGTWPSVHSGPIAEAPGETWCAVGMALRNGLRGLPGGSSLARLLADRRGVRNQGRPPRPIDCTGRSK